MADATQERTEQDAARDEDGPPALDSRELYFNDRVLQLAEDERLPLFERVKFLSIYASNLDEFFMVRVAGHHDQVDAGIEGRGPDGLTANETIDCISARVRELDRRHVEQWERGVRCELEHNGIRIVTCEECSEAEREAAD